MHQHCPNCHKLIEETDTCPHCGTKLNEPYTPPKHKLTRKETAMYALGYIILAIVAFYERDLTNTQQLIEGTVIFTAFIGISVLWFYFSARGGIGYPIK